MTLLPLAVLLVPVSVAAQISITLDATGATSYVWRGVTLTNRFVLQPDMVLSVPIGNSSGALAFGAWASSDVGEYNSPDDLSEGGGTSTFDVTELDLWAEYGRSFGPLSAAVGGLQYLYPNSAGLTNSANRTFEIYGRLQAPNVLFAPKVAAWWDVDKVHGVYAEGSVSKPFKIAVVPLTIGALAGFSFGQGINREEPGEIANFSGNGLTHVDFSLASSVRAGPIMVLPVVHVILANDDLTKITEPGVTHDVKAWAGVTLTWSKAFVSPETAE